MKMVLNQNRFTVAEPQEIGNNDILDYLGHWGAKAESFLENTNTKTPDAGQECFNFEMSQLNIKEVRGNYTVKDYEGYVGAFQQTGFDPFDKMIPNGFITISNSDWYIPDNFVSYYDYSKTINLCWVEVKGTNWIKSSDIEHYRHFQRSVDNWNALIEKAGKPHIKRKAPIEFKIAVYPDALSSYYQHKKNGAWESDLWKPTQTNIDRSYWLTFDELEHKFNNEYREEEELSEKVSFFVHQMHELGFEDYSDRKFRRRI